jgi:hypothetical protein
MFTACGHDLDEPNPYGCPNWVPQLWLSTEPNVCQNLHLNWGTRKNLLETNASIERIIRDARAADEVMQHIRALFKRELFDKTDVSVLDMVKGAVRFVHEDPKKRDVAIDWRLDETLPRVSVDLIHNPTGLRQFDFECNRCDGRKAGSPQHHDSSCEDGDERDINSGDR